MGRGPGALDAVNLLELAPVRTAPWSEKEGRVVVERPAPRGGPLRRAGGRLALLLKTRRVRLDAVGSQAWRMLDGRRTVACVAEALRTQFGEAVEPAEERLGALVRELRNEHLLGYPGFDA